MLIGCCGVGGTGKTTVVNELVKLRPDAVVQPSIVRDYYQRNRIENETEYLGMPPADRFAFQIGLLDYFMTTTLYVVHDNPDRCVIMDRTAYDHAAYCTYGYGDMTLDQLEQVLSYADQYSKLNPVVFRFPYPTPWTRGGDAEDGFRATSVGKNWSLDCMMQRIVRKYAPDAEVVPPWTPSARARRMLAVISTAEAVRREA